VTAAAPLIATSAAPIPTGGVAEWFEGAGGARLRAALFPATTASPRGSVVVHPGRTEPIEKYFEVVDTLRARGFAVLVHDWRGQGLSHRILPDRLPGHADGYADFLTDHDSLLRTFESRLPKPWISLGHSMGGCLAMLILAKGETRYTGAILSAPMLGLSLGKTPIVAARALASTNRALGRGGILARPDPGVVEPFETNILTHDPIRYARNVAQVEASPDLALGGPTWGWLDFALSATEVLQRGPGVPRIAVPVMIAAAGEERLVDNMGSRRVATRCPRARFVEIPGAYHEILQELDALQAPFWAEFDALNAQLGAE
jgi:lysophospholipase